MDIPDSLKARIENFSAQGQAWQDALELFRTESWIYVMLGQGLMPRRWHRLASLVDSERLMGTLARQKEAIAARVAGMPGHGEFITSYAADR